MILFIVYASPKITNNNDKCIFGRITSRMVDKKIWTLRNINEPIRNHKSIIVFYCGEVPHSKISSNSPSVAIYDLLSENIHNTGEKIQAGFKHNADALTNVTP